MLFQDADFILLFASKRSQCGNLFTALTSIVTQPHKWKQALWTYTHITMVAIFMG